MWRTFWCKFVKKQTPRMILTGFHWYTCCIFFSFFSEPRSTKKNKYTWNQLVIHFCMVVCKNGDSLTPPLPGGSFCRAYQNVNAAPGSGLLCRIWFKVSVEIPRKPHHLWWIQCVLERLSNHQLWFEHSYDKTCGIPQMLYLTRLWRYVSFWINTPGPYEHSTLIRN